MGWGGAVTNEAFLQFWRRKYTGTHRNCQTAKLWHSLMYEADAQHQPAIYSCTPNPPPHHPSHHPPAQVLWWKHVEAEYSEEMGAQAELFGGEEGPRRRAGGVAGRVGALNGCCFQGVSRCCFTGGGPGPRWVQHLTLPEGAVCALGSWFAAAGAESGACLLSRPPWSPPSSAPPSSELTRLIPHTQPFYLALYPQTSGCE
jgi:hypothetical protein